jgi:hypothetical protein
MSEEIFSESTALDSLNEYFEYCDIDFEDFKKLEHEGESLAPIFESQQKKLVRAVQEGRLEFKRDDRGRFLAVINCHIEYKFGKTVEFKPVFGRAKMVLDKTSKLKKGGDSDDTRVLRLVGILSGLEYEAVANLEGPDYALAKNLGNFYVTVVG